MSNPTSSAGRTTATTPRRGEAAGLKVRETLLGQRTRLINTLRGHAAEFGVIAAKGTSQVMPLLAAIAAEASIPATAKAMLALLGEEIAHLDDRLKEVEAKLLAMHRASAISQCWPLSRGSARSSRSPWRLRSIRRPFNPAVTW